VSIIITGSIATDHLMVYSGRFVEQIVPEALESIFGQRGAPEHEVVCVDDASMDATPQLHQQVPRLAATGRSVQGQTRAVALADAEGVATGQCLGSDPRHVSNGH